MKRQSDIMHVVCTPLQFIDSIESAVSEALGTQQNFKDTPLVVNRMLQFHEDAACLRLLRSQSNTHELLAIIEVRTVPGENGNQAIQGVCSHVELSRRIPFLFTQPTDKTCKETIIRALESLFADAEKQAGGQAQLESEAQASTNGGKQLEASSSGSDEDPEA